MPSKIVCFSLALLAFASTPALAECPSVPEDIVVLSGQVQKAFEDLDLDAFDATLIELKNQVKCLSTVLKPKDAAVVHRLYGVRAFVNDDEPGALRALQVAYKLDPAYSPPESVAPEGGPLHKLYNRARENPRVASVGFKPPKGMIAYVDGARSGERPISAPSLIQVRDKDGAMYWSGYLTPDDALPAWIKSAKDVIVTKVEDDVMEEFIKLRLDQNELRKQIVEARLELQKHADADWPGVKVAAQKGDKEGRKALSDFFGQYAEATVLVNGKKYPAAVNQVPTARAWLTWYGDDDKTAAIAAYDSKVSAAQALVRGAASKEWETVIGMVHSKDFGARAALDQFVDTYKNSKVAVDEFEESVLVPEVDEAEEWQAIYTLAYDKLPDTTDTLALVLETADERAEKEGAIMNAIASKIEKALLEANGDWETTKRVADSDPDYGVTAMNRFIREYEGLTVSIGDYERPVPVSQIEDAKFWLAHPPKPKKQQDIGPQMAWMPPPAPIVYKPKKMERNRDGVIFSLIGAGLYGSAYYVHNNAYVAEPSTSNRVLNNGLVVAAGVSAAIGVINLATGLGTKSIKKKKQLAAGEK